MTKLDKIVAFVATTNVEQAKLFYRDKLGLTFVLDDGFALIFKINGTTFRIAKVEKFAPAAYTVLGWEVTDIDRAVTELSKKGVSFERFQGMPQDALGIWSSPSGSRVAWFKDPDGNILSLSQHPPTTG